MSTEALKLVESIRLGLSVVPAPSDIPQIENAVNALNQLERLVSTYDNIKAQSQPANFETIDLACSAILKKEAGDHFTDKECVSAAAVLKPVVRFAQQIGDKPLTYWAANNLEHFRQVAINRGIWES